MVQWCNMNSFSLQLFCNHLNCHVLKIIDFYFFAKGMHLHTVRSQANCRVFWNSSSQSRGKEKGHVLLESFMETSRARDKLLMELCFTSSSQRTNEQCREPLAARSYWTHTRGFHGDLARWDSATAGATCFLGSCSLPVRVPSPASAAVSHGVTFPHGHPGLGRPKVPSIPLPYGTGTPASSTSTLRWSSLSPASQKRGARQEICDTQFECCCCEDK